MSTSKEYMVTSMEQILIVPKHMQQEIHHFVNLLLIFNVLKHHHHYGVFLQHHLRQKIHESVFLTSLMGHAQSF
jgi:hypothetical protein